MMEEEKDEYELEDVEEKSSDDIIKLKMFKFMGFIVIGVIILLLI